MFMETRWTATNAPKGDAYDARWETLASAGVEIHGEANFVARVVAPGAAILDGGCGTGRVAIELQRRGYEVVGIDADLTMLASAREKAPELAWVHGDLATFELDRTFDAVVLAGNVMIFVDPGTERRVLERIAAHLRPGGVIIAGFQLRADRLTVADYEMHATSVGLDIVTKCATWDGDPFADGDYVVIVLEK